MTPLRRGCRIALACVALVWLASGALHAQSVSLPGAADPAAEAQEAQLQLEDLQAQIERLEARTSEWRSKADVFDAVRESGPAQREAIEAEIRQLETEDTLALDSVPASELEVRVLSAEQDLSLAQQEVADLATELAGRSERRRQLPELLSDAKTRLRELSQAPPITAEDEAIADLQGQLRGRRIAALEEEVRSYELELLTYESWGEWLEAQSKRAGLRVERLESHLEQLRTALATLVEGEAAIEVERALASVAEVDALDPAAQEAVRRLAEENAALAQGRTGREGLLNAIDRVSRKLTRADRLVSEVEADFQRLSTRLEASGLSNSVGLLLRKTRSDVPDVGKYRRFIRMRQAQIAEVQQRQVELREELDALRNIDGIVDDTVAEFEGNLSESDRTQLAEILRDLLQTKRKYLSALLEDYDVYFQKLVDFDARQQALIEKTTELLSFIDARVLWVPSGGVVGMGVFRDGLEGLRWFTSPRFLGQLVSAVRAAVRDSLYSMAVALALLVAAGPILSRRFGPRLAELAAEARKPTCMSGRPTLEAAALCLLLVPWGPAALGLLGWRLSVSPDATQFVRCFAEGFIAAAAIWLSLELPRQLLRKDGLAEAHFTWPVAAVRKLRSEIGWILAVAVPAVFVIQVFEIRAEEAWRESLGRVSWLSLLVFIAFITHRMFRAEGPARALVQATPLVRVGPGLWRFLHLLGVAAPLALGVAAARGYSYTSLQIGSSYHLTLLFLLMLLILFQLSLRWSLVARRRIAFRIFEEKRKAEEAKRAEGETEELVGDRALVLEEELDLGKVDEQTGRLLATSALVAMLVGLWFLWVDLVPAFAVLDSFELWTTTEPVTLESTAADGTTLYESEERTVPVTLANLLWAGLLAFMTFVLARNLPGLLEISLFRFLGTSMGERYAYTTIATYAVSLIGGLLAFNAVGVGWSNVQWLVAAVGLGLGFGLQEIFANFVAGLIILFERPIRVGDVVTVGDISGTVTKIRIRATWITSFDRKELVVPNKEFVTTQLVNWSLTDPVLRVAIPVGIAYGSDTERAIRELHAAAVANAHVLEDPAPEVLFVGFGASSLDFELRVFSPDIDHRYPIIHGLHLAIDRAFREAGIEIAFPQQDVHIRTTSEGVEAPDPEAGSR